jgi:hypothetical protein
MRFVSGSRSDGAQLEGGRGDDDSQTGHITSVAGEVGFPRVRVDGDIYVADRDGSNPVRIADGRPPKSAS